MDKDIHKEELYAIIVHDFVPELMPGSAFRRDKHHNKAEKKEIKCPYCGGKFKVVDKTAKLELMRYPKRDKAKVRCHKTMPCNLCNGKVGIIYNAA